MNEFRGGKAQQPLPSPLLEHQAQIDQFWKHCLKLCQRVLELFAIGLHIDIKAGGKDFFQPYHDPANGPSGSVFRLLYYPTLPPSEEYDDETDIRAGAHSDYGTITLLFQRPGQPGLEILTSKRGDAEEKWYPVPVNPTDEPNVPVLLNVGDALNFWTGGLLRSTVHRVIFPKDHKGEDRYSIAYFCHAVDDAKFKPIPSDVVRQHSSRANGSTNGPAEPITAKQHLESRLAATYASNLKKSRT
jgi:isopenicillin N synthase-like dioxygenase